MLRELNVYLLPDGHEYVAVASLGHFLLYRAKPDYLSAPCVFVVESDGAVRPRDGCGEPFRVEELIDTGREYS